MLDSALEGGVHVCARVYPRRADLVQLVPLGKGPMWRCHIRQPCHELLLRDALPRSSVSPRPPNTQDSMAKGVKSPWLSAESLSLGPRA